MRITFLGHQGWQFENDGRSFLLDPILETIGNGATQMPVWPQRRLEFSKFEPLEAVIVSHEHADHFSLETLAALPRRCRIYLSDLSSRAMVSIVAEMGFQVRRFSALQPFELCGMKITALPGLYNMLEPDTYALLVQDKSGASFLTSIDTIPHPDVFTWLATNCPTRTLDNLTNNFIEPRHPLVKDSMAFEQSRAVVAGNAVEFVKDFAPRRVVISGQGWHYRDDKSELNHSFFSADNRWLASVMPELAPQVEWYEGLPAMRFTLQGERLLIDQSSAVGALKMPSREFDPQSVRTGEPFAPWSGVEEIAPERAMRVSEFLVLEFGAIVAAYAPKLMERLYYLKFQAGGAAQPSLSIVVRNGARRLCFEFDYASTEFKETHYRYAGSHAVGVEVWASDFELMIGAEEEAFTIYESSVRPWSRVPDLIDESTLNELFMGFTPRFRPQPFLEFYRSRVAALTSPLRERAAT